MFQFYNRVRWESILPLLVALTTVPAAAAVTERVSFDPTGAAFGGTGGRVSAGGRFVTFTNSGRVYVRDRQTETTDLVSIGLGGTPPNSNSSFRASLSADGRFVAFESGASNLVANDTNGVPDIFLYDRQTEVMERVSVDSNGDQANRSSFRTALTPDARFVLFSSYASDLIAGDTNDTIDVFLRDRLAGTTERVSVSSTGAEGDDISGDLSIDITPDGRFVAFESDATNLIDDDTNGWADVYVRDRQEGTTERVSRTPDGGQATDGHSFVTKISANGRFVVFHSEATDLIPQDGNGATDVFIHDRVTRTTERISESTKGRQGNGQSFGPSISDDGRWVAFRSWATNLLDGETTAGPDVFVHDRKTGTTERVSLAFDGAPGNDASHHGTISADGRIVVFQSDATNIVPGDTNGLVDTFVQESVCGDGKLDRPEECDDGNVLDGDGCPASCTFSCAPLPVAGCRRPVVAQKASLILRDSTRDGRDLLQWKWLKGDVTPKADFGDPLTDESYVLCVYDGGGFLMRATAPAAGVCGKGRPCWRERSKGFKYRDNGLTPDGVDGLTMKEGLAAEKAKIILKAKGKPVEMPDLGALTSPVTVQLINTSGLCWEAIYSAPFLAQDDRKFKDKSD